MSLSRTPELLDFFSTYLADGEVEGDPDAARRFVASVGPDRARKVLAQAQGLVGAAEIPLEEIGSEANRWFGEADEAREWLRGVVAAMQSALGQSAESAAGGVVVKDSNGAVLAEGDTVQVIKDLKVRGGSSDLKRGTMIKKIHLIDDPDNIECRVDGSTLVLKTMFLKKA